MPATRCVIFLTALSADGWPTLRWHEDSKALHWQWQIDATGSLVARGGFAIHRFVEHLLVSTSVRGKVNGILDPVAVNIAFLILALQRWPSQPQAYRGQLGVVQRSHPRSVTLQLNIDAGLVLDNRNTWDVGLIDDSGAPFPFHVGKIFVPTRTLHDGKSSYVVNVEMVGASSAMKTCVAQERD